MLCLCLFSPLQRSCRWLIKWRIVAFLCFQPLFVISSFRSLYMDPGSKINFLNLLMAGGSSCMFFFVFFLSFFFSLEYMSNIGRHLCHWQLCRFAILSVNRQTLIVFLLFFSFSGKCQHMEFWSSDSKIFGFLISKAKLLKVNFRVPTFER